MKWWLETTEWSGAVAPNHVYLLNDSKSKMYAYRPFGRGEIRTFKNPISIDLRGRRFQINPEQYKTSIKDDKPAGRTWTVKGSKGDAYTVSEERGNYSCTCTGFKFRGQCKHVENIRAMA